MERVRHRHQSWWRCYVWLLSLSAHRQSVCCRMILFLDEFLKYENTSKYLTHLEEVSLLGLLQL